MMKKTPGGRRLIPIKNLILMLVSLVVILATVFAWYTNNDKVTAEQSSISAKGADNVELAFPVRDDAGNEHFPISNSEWKTDLSFSTSGFLKDLVKDVTSNGKQFAVPSFAAANGLKEGRKVIADDVWTEGLSSKEALTNTSTLDDDQYNYISFDFYIRSKQKDINVTAESFLASGSERGYSDAKNTEAKTKPLKGSDIYRCSSYGAQEGTENAFSSDAIVGAMRVSLEGCLVDSVTTSNGYTNVDSYNGGTWAANSDLRFLWLPRPDIYLETDDNSNNWKLFTGIKPTRNTAQNGWTGAQVDALANKTYAHSFYEGNVISGEVKKTMTPHTYADANVKTITGADETVPACFKVSSANLGVANEIPSLGQSVKITGEPSPAHLDTSKAIQFTAAEGDNHEKTGYYVYKYTLNIWIEGEDAEARRSMNNGLFDLELVFGS